MDTSSPTRKPFQSSPGANAGRIPERVVYVPVAELFQSSPGANAGRIMTGSRNTGSITEFQSSPGANAGRICAFLSVRYDTHFEAVRANRPEMHA